MTNSGLGDRAYIALACLEHIRMVRWEDSSCGSDNWAECVIHLLGLGLVDALLQRRALRCRVGCGCDRRVRAEVVVVVGGCTYYRALFSLVTTREGQNGF
jgi:hypothetical protein